MVLMHKYGLNKINEQETCYVRGKELAFIQLCGKFYDVDLKGFSIHYVEFRAKNMKDH